MRQRRAGDTEGVRKRQRIGIVRTKTAPSAASCISSPIAKCASMKPHASCRTNLASCSAAPGASSVRSRLWHCGSQRSSLRYDPPAQRSRTGSVNAALARQTRAAPVALAARQRSKPSNRRRRGTASRPSARGPQRPPRRLHSCDGSGALGCPVWVLLSDVPNWRWFRERDDSPWFPAARLFRQRTQGNWEAVFARVAATLLAAAPPRPDP